MKISQYCSVCKAVLEMTVVPTSEGDEDGVIWLRCPQCQGFLPKFKAGSGDAAAAAPVTDASPRDDTPAAPAVTGNPAGGPPAPPEAPPLDIDPAVAVPYRPWGSYPVGTVIHHLAWDDYGVVAAVEALPGKRRAVRVRFEKAGEVRLIVESEEGP